MFFQANEAIGRVKEREEMVEDPAVETQRTLHYWEIHDSEEETSKTSEEEVKDC